MTKWKTYKLGDVCSRLRSGKGISASEVSSCGKFAVIGGNGVRGYADKSNFNGQCVVVGRQGAYCGNIRYFDGEFYMTEHAVVIVGNELADTHFLAYLLSTMHLGQLSAQSAQPGLSVQTLSKLEISLPGLEEQRRIAGILGAIDDKIENNRRINTNLELQAQALFDKIFFDDNDAERNPLSDYADINPTRTLRQGVVARYIEMANLPTKGSFPSDWSYKSYGGGCKFANGDTIMARITPCLENGKTAYIDFLEEQEVAFGSTEYIVISAKSGYCPALFYFLARNKEFVDYAVGHMNGSSGRQRVSGADIANFPMPHITLEESNKFAEIAMPIMDVIRNNSLENRHLATLRDALLPKLMNGEMKL
ncbi:MAG: restriction endonuclease subunit S [Muribaculaceae bacterium]|nr:restriction endonuclease subunit S [Muribaculaceae bacterium]